MTDMALRSDERMTDREKLREYRDAVELIKETEARIERLRRRSRNVVTDKVMASNPEWPYQPISITIEGAEADLYGVEKEIALQEELLETRRKALVTLTTGVEAMISRAPLTVARIINYKYLDGLTWEQTAARMGGGNTAEGVRKAVRRWLKEPSKSEGTKPGESKNLEKK
jgi:DNA-directed RNA polymerase specialized sigma24 family protein